MAINTLAEEQNISMTDAKSAIDEYDSQLKQRQQQKVLAIASKQGVIKSNTPIEPSPDEDSSDKMHTLNAGLDSHLHSIGYKKPLIPYWVKRVSIIIIVILALGLIISQLLP